MGTDYRADIDGLRAVAVLLVVLCHLGIGPAGGFVGVDVFFVVSGYLITGIVRSELRDGTFSFRRFYTRRARRILPALVAVCAFCLVAGWFLLLPSDLESLGVQVVTALLGLSNIYFALSTGYFDQSAELLPLLHTWSLGVEEQFYLVWPLALLLLHRRRRISRTTAVWIGCGVLLAALAAAQLIVWKYADAAFYLPFSRAWELALGAAVTYLPRVADRRIARSASIAGLAMIVAAALLYSDDTVFPGLAAILPCLGAALVVWPPAQHGIGNRLMALPPFVWVGKISYSLYLWHWPVLVFAKHYFIGQSVSWPLSLVLLLTTIIISALCWTFIEQPFRQRRVDWRSSAAAAVAVLLAGWTCLALAGFPDRLSEDGRRIAGFRESSQPLVVKGACDLSVPKSCLLEPDGRKRVLLLGDSHARHYAGAFVAAFPEVYLSFATRSQCRPVINPAGNETCVEVMRDIYAKLIPSKRYDAIILSARWRNGQSDQVAASVAYLKQFADSVIVFGQTVEYSAALPDLLLADEMLRAPVDLTTEPPRAPSLRALNSEIERAALAAGAQFYDPLTAICSTGACRTTTADGTPMQVDYGHFTRKGAEFVLDGFKAEGLSF